jgi:peroxiredoxin Q/BCP
VDIVGVSFNKPEKNAEWAAHEGFQFPLWTDQDKALALRYGSISTRLAPVPGRVTVILDREGRLVKRYDDVDVGTHPAEVLEDCEALFASPSP